MKATAVEVESRFGEFLEKARQEPVMIEQNGQACAVLVSSDDLERLQAMQDFWWATRAQEAERSGFVGSKRVMQELSERSLENAGAELLAAVRAGDKDAWYALLEMAPPVAHIDAVTGLATAAPPREAVRREHLYED
jgi:prevent-host-death family protein